MYQESERESLHRQLGKRWLLLAAALCPLAAVSILFAIQRNQTLTIVFSCAAAFLFLFVWSMMIQPLSKYAVHLDNMLEGRTHEVEGTFTSLDPDESVVEGVSFRAMHVEFIADDDKPYDRLFYWDCEKPLPAYEPGDRLKIRYHDRMVVQCEKMEQ